MPAHLNHIICITLFSATRGNLNRTLGGRTIGQIGWQRSEVPLIQIAGLLTSQQQAAILVMQLGGVVLLFTGLIW